MKHKEIPISEFRDKFEYKMSKLSDEKLERLQKIIIKKLCKLEADNLDFYDYKKQLKNTLRRMLLKIIKTVLFLFLITFTTHSFAKTNGYYKQTLTHILTQCNSECQKKVFEQEVQSAFFDLMDAILNQIQFELSQQKKEKLWSKDL